MNDTSTQTMQTVLDLPLATDQAALWFLGQAGYIIRTAEVALTIDPYLSDSVGRAAPRFARAIPVPLAPRELNVDLFIVTHDHLDHLDPDTIEACGHRDSTLFVAPRLAAKKLAAVGVDERRIHRVDAGETARLDGVTITGAYAVPTEPAVIDTTGYLLEFDNGRSVYHTSDTGWSDLLATAAPQRPDVLLVCINGKFGNLNAEQAARLTAAVRPRIAVPNHYDVMALNSENPDTYVHFARQAAPGARLEVQEVMRPLIWAGE